jgi:chloramphenicol 3-O phosphotransferase
MKLRYGLVLVLLTIFIVGFFMERQKSGLVIKKGIVVIFNGASSSGKTTAQKKLQSISKEFFLRIGIDSFFDALIAEPDLTQFHKEGILEQYTSSGELIRSVIRTHDKEGNQVIPLTIGSAGTRIIHGMHRALAAYADAGNNIIVDYILYDPVWIIDLKKVLADYTVYLIGFKGPLSVIEERERVRATSPAGHARSHYDTVHVGIEYDLVVDIEQSPEAIATTINEYIQNHKNP